MLIYGNEFSKIISTVLEKLFPVQVQQHIQGITDASPTSHFYCKIEDKASTVYVYLIEQNHKEFYTVCHLFSYDHIGEDYQYQSLPLEQVQVFGQFASQFSIL